MANTSLTLGEHWEMFIKNEIASGRYRKPGGNLGESNNSPLVYQADGFPIAGFRPAIGTEHQDFVDKYRVVVCPIYRECTGQYLEGRLSLLA